MAGAELRLAQNVIVTFIVAAAFQGRKFLRPGDHLCRFRPNFICDEPILLFPGSGKSLPDISAHSFSEVVTFFSLGPYKPVCANLPAMILNPDKILAFGYAYLFKNLRRI